MKHERPAENCTIQSKNIESVFNVF